MRVLVADDDPTFRIVLQSMIEEWGHEVILASDGMEAWTLLQGKNPPPLAVLDWMMPELDGLELCRRIRSQCGPNSYTYIIVLTSLNQTDDVVNAIEAGADDFVSKPCKSQELRVRLRAGQRLVELNEQLRIKATRDGLTGAFNRAHILELLEREMTRAARSGLATGLLMMDVDHFKKVNDTYGHSAGDAVLVEVSQRLANGIRGFDLLGRVGGEEFLAVLPECDIPEATIVAERLRQSLVASPIQTKSATLDVTISVGVAAVPPAPDAIDEFLGMADAALYEAKRSGRNRVQVGQP